MEHKKSVVFNLRVFNNARDGKLSKLKLFLDRRSKEEVAMLVSSRTNGATPLLMACRNGHVDVAVYLIEKCSADIEQVGSVTFDGETIEGAPPLWCAAAAGHLNLVKILVRHKASVNSTTKTNSTPLRAACYDGHFEIVKYLVQHGADIEIANRHGHTCLMIACYKGHYDISKYLVECGANVNRKSEIGNTALHDCAESGSLDILKLLLERGAKFDSDSFGTTPLLSAAVKGHVAIVDFFIHEFECSKQEKIDGLELLGATLVDDDRSMALDCWRLAMQLRYEEDEFPLPKPTARSPVASYVEAVEVQNFSQLEELLSDPDEMRMQALLIRDRILSPGHPDTVYYIRYRGATFANNGDFDKCIQLWMYALDIQQTVHKPLNPRTQSSLLGFVELFSCMMSESWSFARGFPVPPVAFKDILHVFERALKEIERALELNQREQMDSSDLGQFHHTLTIALHLIVQMCRLQPHLNKSEEIELKKAVYRLVHMNPRVKNGWTPLHLACFKETSALGRFTVFTFPSLEVVNLFLEVGAYPNAVDVNHNTPLHITAMNKQCVTTTAVFKSLLDHGAHLDVCNNERKTPYELVKNSPLLDIYPLRYINLQCLSAQVVRNHQIPYKSLLHKRLEVFLDKH